MGGGPGRAPASTAPRSPARRGTQASRRRPFRGSPEDGHGRERAGAPRRAAHAAKRIRTPPRHWRGACSPAMLVGPGEVKRDRSPGTAGRRRRRAHRQAAARSRQRPSRPLRWPATPPELAWPGRGVAAPRSGRLDDATRGAACKAAKICSAWSRPSEQEAGPATAAGAGSRAGMVGADRRSMATRVAGSFSSSARMAAAQQGVTVDVGGATRGLSMPWAKAVHQRGSSRRWGRRRPRPRMLKRRRPRATPAPGKAMHVGQDDWTRALKERP